MNWMGIIPSEPVKEEEMSSLATGFAAWMHKQAMSSEGETTPRSDGKRSKRYSPDEEAQKD